MPCGTLIVSSNISHSTLISSKLDLMLYVYLPQTSYEEDTDETIQTFL